MSEGTNLPVKQQAPGPLAELRSSYMKHLGTALAVGTVAVGAAILILARQLMEGAPAEPFAWVVVALIGVVAYQAHRIRRLKSEAKIPEAREPVPPDEPVMTLVTHLGVWWKVDHASGYIEDFPYCPCCEPPRKLVQTDWVPEDKFRCPHTATEVGLYDGGGPRSLSGALSSLHLTYDAGRQLETYLWDQYHRLEGLSPEVTKEELVARVFDLTPMSRVPSEERSEILAAHPDPANAFSYVGAHVSHFQKYIKREGKEERATPTEGTS